MHRFNEYPRLFLDTRFQVKKFMQQFFDTAQGTCRIIMTPTMSKLNVPVGAKICDKLGIFLPLANICECPAISVPQDPKSHSAIQYMAGKDRDDALLDFVAKISKS